jgi:hypothetical protein
MNEESTIFSKLIDNISKIKNIKAVKKTVLDSFMSDKIEKPNKSGSNLRILILNTPCFGSGDIIFAIKLANYVREWYGANVSIASTQIDKFKALGETKNLISLVNRNNDLNNPQCRRFKGLKFQTDLHTQDLIFVAPMQTGQKPNIRDIKYIIPYSNVFNTYFFSEYNHPDNDKYFDFPTGLGGKKYGLLFTNPKINIPRSNKLKNPYGFLYIADTDKDENCFMSYVEMVAAKYYKKYKKFDIVLPPNMLKKLNNNESKIIKKVKRYYKNIICVTKDDEYYILEGKSTENFLTFRFDVLPVPNKEFLGLMENSVEDILVTGDQSITDALSCCSSKNIFYQIARWKRMFGKGLAKYMPNQYLKSYKTSCGTLKAVKYKSNYNKFVKQWDFRTLAKPKMDAIIRYANSYKNK